jgi:UDP-N-acetylglucosamine transferase subunit ALG13
VEPSSLPLVFTTVGTDHHRFDRLVEWVDGWALERRGRSRCFVQSGTSAPPSVADWSPYVSYDELQSSIREAAAVVCHGGPATIMECRRHGLVPIVVPRRRDLGEHVDDHQGLFTERLAAQQEIHLVSTREALWRLLDRAVAEPGVFRSLAEAVRTDETVERFTTLVDGLRSGRKRRRARRTGGGTREVAPSTMEPLVILYIGGWGRSGSTLLARMLAQAPGVVSVGELRDVWLRGCTENRLCGCGRPFLECPFWTAVGDEAFGGWARVDTASMLRLRREVDRPWTVPLVLAGRSRKGFDERVSRYTDALGRVYAAIKHVSGARIIVDSSKIPSYGLLLTRMQDADVRVVHLVRDSRGVVFSWQKHVGKPDRPGTPDQMLRYSVLSASARYLGYNLMTHGFRSLGTPYLMVRYEDLVTRPARELKRILRGMGDEARSLDFVEEHTVALKPTHTVDGNPMRFSEGKVALRADDEWRRSMRGTDRAVVTALTAPLLVRYGYLDRGGAG